MKVQNVYVNYLRQLLKNIEDCKTSLSSDTAESKKKSLNKDSPSSTSSQTQGQFPTPATSAETGADVSDNKNDEATTCQNIGPNDVRIKSEPVTEDGKGDADLCELIPSDIMAILQAQVLQKSLGTDKDSKDSKYVNEGARETAVGDSSLSFIHSLIEDEFKELNCD